MTRKSLGTPLPSLAELFSDYICCPESENGHKLLTDFLRDAAKRLQKKGNQSFYSLRELGRFLSVPTSSLALIYEKLEKEGLLIRIRGSGTLLLGKISKTQHPARTIVAVPIPASSIASSSFARSFCIQISKELWRNNFVVNLMICPLSEFRSPQFTDRIRKQSDTIIWLFPDNSMKNTILMLNDSGVRSLMLSAVEEVFSPPAYLMDWTSVYRKALCAWKAEGIQHIVVARGSDFRHQKVLNRFLPLLDEIGFSFSLAEPDAAALSREVEVRRKRKLRTGCTIIEHKVIHRLCNHEPIVMARLTTRCRMLFGRGGIFAPYFINRDFRADVIGFSGEAVATRVARDLSHRHGSSEMPVRLSPVWIPNAALSEVYGNCPI